MAAVTAAVRAAEPRTPAVAPPTPAAAASAPVAPSGGPSARVPVAAAARIASVVGVSSRVGIGTYGIAGPVGRDRKDLRCCAVLPAGPVRPACKEVVTSRSRPLARLDPRGLSQPRPRPRPAQLADHRRRALLGDGRAGVEPKPPKLVDLSAGCGRFAHAGEPTARRCVASGRGGACGAARRLPPASPRGRGSWPARPSCGPRGRR